MTTSTTPAPSSTAPPAHAAGRPIARGAALGIAFAVVADVAIWAIGRAGAPTRVITGSSPDGVDLGVPEVVVTAVVAIGLGAVLLWLLERSGRDRLRAWNLVAVVVAVVSALPLLRLDVDAASKVALVAMHLATGAAAIAGHHLARNRR